MLMSYAMREWTAVCAAAKAHKASLELFKQDYGTLVCMQAISTVFLVFQSLMQVSHIHSMEAQFNKITTANAILKYQVCALLI